MRKNRLALRWLGALPSAEAVQRNYDAMIEGAGGGPSRTDTAVPPVTAVTC